MSYSAAPVDIQTLDRDQRTLSIDLDAVDNELARIAPAYEWQNHEWNTLTLLAAALATSPSLARARATVEAAEAEALAARVRQGPTLTLTAEYAFNPTEASNWLYGLASDLLLDRGGRRRGRIETADVAARAAVFDYAAAVWSVRMAIRRAFDSWQSALAEAGIASELVAMRRRQFEAVNRRVAAGEASRLELDRVRADLAIDSRTELEARARVTRAAIDLATAVGVVPEALDDSRLVDSFDNPVMALPAITDEQVAGALELRTEVLQATAAYDRSEAAVRIAVASQYPEIRLGPGYTWERGLRKLPFNLSLTLPTSDRARATIAAAEARRAEAGKQLETAVATVEASIAQSDADYRAALAVLELVRTETLPTASALADQAERELNAGAINRADWAAAQAGRLTARLDEVAAIRGVRDAESALEDALRRPLRGPETTVGSALLMPAEDNSR